MEAKIDEKLASIQRDIETVESQIFQYQERLAYYQDPPPLDPSQLDAGMKWVYEQICKLDDKKNQLLNEKQELEDLRVLAERKDLEYVVRAATYRF